VAVGDVDRRQRRGEPVGERHVVEPDHRHVARAVEAGVGERGVGPERQQVVRRHDARGRLRRGQQRPGGPGPAGDGERLALRDLLAADGEAGVAHRLDEPAAAQQAGGGRLRPGDVADAGVAETGQVGDRGRRPAPVVRHDGEDAAAVDGAVDEDDGQVRRDGVGDDRMAALGRRDHEAVDLARDQRLEPLPLPGRLAVGRGDEGGVPGGVEHPLDAADDGREERVLEVGDQHPDGERPPRLQPARDRIQRVAHLARGLLDPVGRGGIHQLARPRVEHARDGARMHPGGAGDVAHRDLPLRHGSL